MSTTPYQTPPPIRTDKSNAFANNTMRARLPAIIHETLALNADFSTGIKRRLTALRDDLAEDAEIGELDRESAPDWTEWSRAIQAQREIVAGALSWQNAEWFFAETYAYRRLIEAVRWHETGRDPFLPKKLMELHSAALWDLVARGTEPEGKAEADMRRAFTLDLWANRIDLSYAASLEKGTAINPEDWLADDRDKLLAHLMSSASGGSAYIVADNAGSELAMDLLLADCLLRHRLERVVICLKWHPTFVSDATPADVWLMLAEMRRRAPELAERLESAWSAERLRFLPDPYWNSSRFLRDLPTGIRRHFEKARLVVIKGDANYRRAVGDCLWRPEMPFADVMRYLDAPVLCLRTLKSDPVVGLPDEETAARLDRLDPQWRVNGQRGLLQFKP